jgi:hypothetical protein
VAVENFYDSLESSVGGKGWGWGRLRRIKITVSSRAQHQIF